MGHKINPFSFRLGVIFDWKSRWFHPKKYGDYLEQDHILRSFIKENYKNAGISDVQIERTAGIIKIIIRTARPGIIIGRGGSGIEDLRKKLENKLKEKTVLRLDVEEVSRPEMDAQIVAQNMANQLEARQPFRFLLKQTIEKVIQNKEVRGVKIKVSGRLDGAEISRVEHLTKGEVPLQTLRSNIDYGTATAHCIYGTIGIKVWIYKGEIFNARTKKS